ncbi:MAG: T9SS type A sorting domain-containing protein [Sporocytophaga sp.]|nr:T9SS type A sorting domain-containing protein [Sporocytophaga sp.]
MSQLLLTGLITFISILTKADSNVPCGSGISQTTVLGTNCQNCSVLHPLLAVDDDTNSFSTIKLAPDIHYGYVAQRIKFSSAGSKKDQIKIKLSFSDPIYDRKLISNIFISTVVGNNINTERVNFNDKDVKLFWSSLQDVVVIFKPDENFQGVEIYLKAENNNKVRAVHLHYATVLPAPPEVQKGQVITCKGQPAVLQATKPLGANFKWYSQQSGGIPVYTGATFSTPAITSETTYYVEAIQSGCVIAQRTPVIIKPALTPDAPMVSGVTICSGQSATLTASGSPSVTFNWYDQSGSGAIIATGASFSTPPLINSATYYVEASINGCTSERKLAPVNIRKEPSIVWYQAIPQYSDIQSIARTQENNYVLAGYYLEYTASYYAGNTYFKMTRTDSLGNILSTKNILLDDEVITNNVTQHTSDNGYIFAGTKNDPLNLAIFKIDSSGAITWALEIPAGPHQNGTSSIIENNDGTYLVAGYTSNTNGKQFDFWALKLDNSGNILWSKTYGGPYEDILLSAVALQDGGYALGGYSTFDIGYGVWVVRIDASGNLLWEKKYNKSNWCDLKSLLLTPDGGFLLYASDYEADDIWIIKTDSMGNVVWDKLYGGRGYDSPKTITSAYGGGYIAGETKYASGLQIFKIDDEGTIQWNITLGRPETLITIFNNNDGSYFLGGGGLFVKLVDSNVNCSAREAKENVSEEAITSYTTTAFPNPFNSYVNVTIAAQEAGDLHVQLFSIEGTLLREVRQYINSGEDIVSFKTDNLPAGAYIVKLILNNQVVTEKLIKNN